MKRIFFTAVVLALFCQVGYSQIPNEDNTDETYLH